MGDKPGDTVHPMLHHRALDLTEGHGKGGKDLGGSDGAVSLLAELLGDPGEHGSWMDLAEQVGGDVLCVQLFRDKVVNLHIVDGGVCHGEVYASPEISGGDATYCAQD